MLRSSPPSRELPGEDWSHLDLYRSVREALRSLPVYFETETFIEGVSATDIFTLNSAFGATIETQVVAALNRMRPIWDPDEEYLLYRFVRQSQTFPDVLLRKAPDRIETAEGQASDASADGDDILMGIELKGWYLLAKEGEPSFRYKVTPAACERQDLIAVVPWALQNVISGSPRVFAPYVESARYAATYRNYYWQVLRDTSTDTTIHPPADVSPYPDKADHTRRTTSLTVLPPTAGAISGASPARASWTIISNAQRRSNCAASRPSTGSTFSASSASNRMKPRFPKRSKSCAASWLPRWEKRRPREPNPCARSSPASTDCSMSSQSSTYCRRYAATAAGSLRR